MLDGVLALFGTPAAGRLADLTELAADWRPDLVVHEVLKSRWPARSWPADSGCRA